MGHELRKSQKDIEKKGDVRIITPDKALFLSSVFARLAMVELAPLSKLEPHFPGIRQFYDPGTADEATVGNIALPDPRTFRPCTPEEIDYYVHEGDIASHTPDPRNIIVIPKAYDGIPGFDTLRQKPNPEDLELQPDARSFDPSNMLTTTINRDTGALEAPHFDKGSAYERRASFSWSKANRGFLAGVKSVALLNEQFGYSITKDRSWRTLDEARIANLGPMLRIRAEENDSYIGWTGRIYHDGTTLLQDGDEAAEAYKKRLSGGFPVNLERENPESISEVGFYSLE